MVQTSAQPRRYRATSRAFTFREYRQGASLWAATISYLISRLPLRTLTFLPIAAVHDWSSCRVSRDAIPEPLRQAIEPMERQFESQGFHSPSYFYLRDDINRGQIVSIDYCDPAGDAIGVIHLLQWDLITPPRRTIHTELITRFTDDTWLATTSTHGTNSRPWLQHRSLPDADVEQLRALHRQTLATSQRTAHPCLTADDAARVADAIHARIRDEFLERGIFVPADDDAGPDPADKLNLSPDAPERPVLLAMRRRPPQQQRWVNALFILLISVGAFIGLGAAAWSLRLTLLLVPILLFHELGHYLVMRVLGYRDLRMFFIPLFGAAVTGKAENVPPWKRVIVSLAGPVPGILLALPLSMLGDRLDQPILTEVALLSLIINGFNLLPVMPLDGGWIVYTLLFSRHHLLSFVYRLGAAVTLIAAGLWLQTALLMLLGVFFLMSLRSEYMLGRLIASLRREQVKPVAADDPESPCADTLRVVRVMQERLPKQSPIVVAAMCQRIVEALRTPPPRLPATIALLTVHAGALVAALVIFAVIMADGTWFAPADPWLEPPRYAFTCGGIERILPADDTARFTDANRTTLIVTFDAQERAAQVWATLRPDLPDTVAAVLFGQSVLIATPDALMADRFTSRLWQAEPLRLDTLTQYATDFIYVKLSCTFSDAAAAAAVEAELADYFELPIEAWLIPPWTPDAVQSSQLVTARRYFRSLREGDNSATPPTDPHLRQQLEQLAEEGAKLDAMADDPSSALETPDEFHFQYSDWAQRVGEHLGQFPIEDDAPLGANRYGATGGAWSEGSTLHLISVNFADPVEGLPALTNWLCERGAGELHYDFMHLGDLFDLPELQVETETWRTP